MKTYDEVTNAIESALEGTGWSFEFWDDADGGTHWTIKAHSPAGEDCVLEGVCSDPETAPAAIVNEVSEYVGYYDPEEHAAELIETRDECGVPDLSTKTIIHDGLHIGKMHENLRDRIDALVKPGDDTPPSA